MRRRRLPSLNALRSFEAYARSGSMVMAAEELCVTHGAVSRQIRSLERELGVVLVSGPRHSLRLTRAGLELANALREGLDRIAEGLPASGEADDLVISVPTTFAMKWLIPRLSTFHEGFPGVNVRIIEASAHALFDGDDGARAAIRLLEGAPPPGLAATAFLEHAYGPVVAPALFEADGGDPARILSRPRLTSDTFSHGWSQWAEAYGVDLPKASAARRFEHNTYLLEAVAGGLGVAVTAWAFAEADIVAGRLIAPWGFCPLPTRFTFLRPSRGGHPAAPRLANWLVREGRRSAPFPRAKTHAPSLSSRLDN